MGMFDDIHSDAMRCPLCGETMGWQSKDGPCLLEKLTVHELMDQGGNTVEFHSECDECAVWVEVKVQRHPGRRTRKQRRQLWKERFAAGLESNESQTALGVEVGGRGQ